jgi:hypothetical protein
MMLGTHSSEVPSTPAVEAWEARPSRLQSSGWSNLLWINWRTWGLPAKVDGGSTAETEGDHMASLIECRAGGTWAERPQ